MSSGLFCPMESCLLLLTTQQTVPGQQASEVHATVQTRAFRRPQLSSGGCSSCSGASSRCFSQSLLSPMLGWLCQAAPGQALGGIGSSWCLFVDTHLPSLSFTQCLAGKEQYPPHSFRNSGASHKRVQNVETAAKRREWEGRVQWERLEGAGPLITAQWGWGRKR